MLGDRIKKSTQRGGFDIWSLRTAVVLLVVTSVLLVTYHAAEYSGLIPSPPHPPDTAKAFIWVQPAPDAYVTEDRNKKARPGEMIARIVLPPGSHCPEIMVDQRPYAMHTRAPMTRTDFPVTLCEHRYDGGSEASLLGEALPRRPNQLKRVLVIGDTGCRVTLYVIQKDAVQNCNDDDEWPLHTLAKHLAGEAPFDLIIHVGDYHYLEASCPDSLRECRGKPAGDRWDSWKADFFDPIRPLLLEAPWVMVRGNHEDCERAGTGWLHLLGPERLRNGAPAACRDDTDPYWLNFEKVSLLVLDTANAGSKHDADQRAKTYQGWLQRAFGDKPQDLADVPAWLISQEPIWQWPNKNSAEKSKDGVWLAGRRSNTLEKVAREVIERAESDNTPGQRFDLVVSGDTHVFEAVLPKTEKPYPSQLVFGMSGTALDDRDNDFANFLTTKAGPHKLKLFLGSDRNEYLDMEVYLISEFGYGVLNHQNNRWTAKFHALDGSERVACRLRGPEQAARTTCELDGDPPS